MIQDFKDEFISDHVDPLHSTEKQEFDWQGLYRALGETKGEPEPEHERLTFALKQILAWLVTAPLDRKGCEIIGRRAIALAWVINPEYFDGQSLTAIAKVLKLSAPSLSKHSAAFSRRFRVANRAQLHGWNRLDREDRT